MRAVWGTTYPGLPVTEGLLGHGTLLLTETALCRQGQLGHPTLDFLPYALILLFGSLVLVVYPLESSHLSHCPYIHLIWEPHSGYPVTRLEVEDWD